jgi:hypothetical protein
MDEAHRSALAAARRRRYVSRYPLATHSHMAAAAQARSSFLVLLVVTGSLSPRLAGASTSTEAAAAGRGVTLRVDPSQVRYGTVRGSSQAHRWALAWHCWRDR